MFADNNNKTHPLGTASHRQYGGLADIKASLVLASDGYIVNAHVYEYANNKR